MYVIAIIMGFEQPGVGSSTCRVCIDLKIAWSEEFVKSKKKF